jgi:hypothetical protein
MCTLHASRDAVKSTAKHTYMRPSSAPGAITTWYSGLYERP